MKEQGFPSLLASLLTVAPAVQEGARIIFSNQNLTVNYGLAFLTVATVIACKYNCPSLIEYFKIAWDLCMGVQWCLVGVRSETNKHDHFGYFLNI